MLKNGRRGSEWVKWLDLKEVVGSDKIESVVGSG